MAATAATDRKYSLGLENDLPVKATSQIYKGMCVGFSSGYARALVAADRFAGFALESKLGLATDGLVTVNVRERGIAQVAITSAAVTDIGKKVYASADDTFTFTSTSNTLVGVVRRWISTGVVEIFFSVTELSEGL